MTNLYKSTIAKNFEKFLKALQSEKKDNFDATFQIYYDLFRIRNAQWSYKLSTNRGVDYSLADIFQDIIAHYLRKHLPKKYTIFLENNNFKLIPDILIKNGKDNWAII